MSRRSLPALWPLFGLQITTERLELRPVADADIDELAALAQQGIHRSDAAPFGSLWTDRRGPEFERAFAQYFWSQRARWSQTNWTLAFAVRWGDALVGVQQIGADDFATLKTVTTSSWLGQSFHGVGLGTEMRGAVLALAFDRLGAEIALSGAFHDNTASIRVSEKLGYARNGVRRENVRGRSADALLFRLTYDSWVRDPGVAARIDGLEPCLALFGLPGHQPSLAVSYPEPARALEPHVSTTS